MARPARRLAEPAGSGTAAVETRVARLQLKSKLEIINRAVYLRGLFIQRYTGIEFSISALIVAARGHVAYNYLGDLPYRFDNKLRRLEDLISLDGPLNKHAEQYREMVSRFVAMEDTRNFMAHAMMASAPNRASEAIIRFAMYSHLENAVVHIGHMDISLDAFEELVLQLTPLASDFAGLAARDGVRLVGGGL